MEYFPEQPPAEGAVNQCPLSWGPEINKNKALDARTGSSKSDRKNVSNDNDGGRPAVFCTFCSNT